MDIKNKNVLVVGLARSGIPTVKVLHSLGAKITINDIKKKEDLKEILGEISEYYDEYILGTHPSDLDKFDLIVLSPGVPTDLSFLKKAKEKDILIIGELELAYRLSKGSFIGITGTNGKTTTTALTGEIFKAANKETYVVGNIGIPAIEKALETTEESVLVTEVSSFQLESIQKFRPKVSAILNITPDHLNRHKTMENYIDAKANVFRNQIENDVLILNYDNENTRKLANRAKSKVIFFSRKTILDQGVYVENDIITVNLNGNKYNICKVKDINIPGKHNLENALAATAISFVYDIDTNIISSILKTFKGVEHRIEFVDNINGVKFYNDSKGTNPDASMKAIDALDSPLILIAGGMDKGSNFEKFIDSFNGKVKKMCLIGETAELIKKTAEDRGFKDVIILKNMEEAVRVAFENAKVNDTILLSPACASWDMYPNFEARGKHFKQCVFNLRRS